MKGMATITKKRGFYKYEVKNPSIEKFLKDPELEEIMVNRAGEPVFVYHAKHGMCETNLVMSEREIIEWINNAALEAGDVINEEKPFLDARLPDGSRLNATIPPATPNSPTITIRKFKQNPLSIVSLIQNSTLSSEAAAFLWEAVEGERNYPFNILVIGGAGAGKTTLLNILTSFIPKDERIVVIEDTLELNFFGRKNVVRMESKHAVANTRAITMNDLLINALRMRPDRLIVGEVRGPEAETLFNAMNVGHSAMGTLHANSPAECISRLTNPPMNVPKNMLGLMDFIIVCKKIRSPEGLKRRVSSIVEVQRSEIGISFSELFVYNAKTDKVESTNIPSGKIEELAKLCGKSRADINKEIKKKQNILEEMLSNGVVSFKDVLEVITEYYNSK